MIKINKTIEVVRSSSALLNSLTLVSAKAVTALLQQHYARVSMTDVSTPADLAALVARNPDLVFLGVKFVPTDVELGMNDPHKVWVAEYLSDNGIANTGSNQYAHELELDKSLAKQRVYAAGLATSPFYVAKYDVAQYKSDMVLQFPLFVKPTNRGGGVGIDARSVVNTRAELAAKVQSISSRYQADSLVEQYLSGREFSVAILKKEDKPGYAVMPLELIAPVNEDGARILSAQVKCDDTERVVEVTDIVLRAKVTKLAMSVFTALGARDYGRIDIRLDSKGIPQFLEANLIPSLIAGYGSFPKACMLNLGLAYEPMILRIVRLGLMRQINRGQDAPELDNVGGVLQAV